MNKKNLTFIIVCSVLFTLITAGSAFAAFPAISENKPLHVYTISTGNTTPAYGSQSTSTKIGTIYASDDLRVFRIDGSWVYLDYPTSSGRKKAWVPLSTITINNMTHVATARAQVTTYRRASNVNAYGYISKGDAVTAIASSNGYIQVVYPISGGQFKMGWISQSNYDAYIKPVVLSSTTTTMTNALYKINTSQSLITCGFDGYINTSGRHEGIDFKYGLSKPVYSLTGGVITNVVFGATGSKGLSTIAVFDGATNKTVIYLHTSPLSSLRAGQQINKGQQIAVESWRGVSSSGGAHTHVEVRSGRQTLAAKSVDDPVLNNSNPTSFWNSQGYSLK